MRARYIIDLDELAATAKIARANADKLGVRLLMALKSFPLPAAFPALVPSVEGFTCSGLYEAKLARLSPSHPSPSHPSPSHPSPSHLSPSHPSPSHLSPSHPLSIHVHAPAYQDDEIDELCAVCSHIVFNSLTQLARYGVRVKAKGVSVGLRINPGVSSADCLKYDPCCPDSRFGVLLEELDGLEEQEILDALKLVDGLHLHALCEGYADDFAQMVETMADKLAASSALAPRLGALQWINLGGGEVINDPAFASPRAIAAIEKLKAVLRQPATSNRQPAAQIFIEPSEYLVRYAGYLEAHVLDVIRREKDIAVLDVSASCHATDLVLFDMKPDVVSPAQAKEGKTTILGCVSCLAGDVLGEYVFAKPLAVGDTVLLGGLGCYSFAQLSWFNGIRHPDLVLRSKAKDDETVLHWTFADYRREFVGR